MGFTSLPEGVTQRTGPCRQPPSILLHGPDAPAPASAIIRRSQKPDSRQGGADIRRSTYEHRSLARPWRGQLSPVGIAIGCVGCVIITASSVYTALKMGALPWPTIFTSIVALFALRAFGHRSLNEANVTRS